MKIVFMGAVQLLLKIHFVKFKMIFLIILEILGKQLHRQPEVYYDR